MVDFVRSQWFHFEIRPGVYVLVPGWTTAGESRGADMGQVVIYPRAAVSYVEPCLLYVNTRLKLELC